jgi:hypothetical protein
LVSWQKRSKEKGIMLASAILFAAIVLSISSIDLKWSEEIL